MCKYQTASMWFLFEEIFLILFNFSVDRSTLYQTNQGQIYIM